MHFIYCHYKEILQNECENSLKGRKYHHLLYYRYEIVNDFDLRLSSIYTQVEHVE